MPAPQAPNAATAPRPPDRCHPTAKPRPFAARFLVRVGICGALLGGCTPNESTPEGADPVAASTEGSGAPAGAAASPEQAAAVAPPTPAGLLLRGTFVAVAEEPNAPVRTGISWDGERLAWLSNGQVMREDQCRIVDETTQDVTLSCVQEDGTTTSHQWVLLDEDRVVHAVTPAVVLARTAAVPDSPPETP